MRLPPIFSGNEVVGAATMPPVGEKVSAFSVINERKAASDHLPAPLQVDDHLRQNCSVSSSALKGSGDFGIGKYDGAWVKTNGTLSPAATVNSPMVFMSSPRRETGVLKQEHVWSGDGAQHPVLQSADPGNGAAVVEAYHELASHFDAAFDPHNNSHDVGRFAFRRHEIDQADASLGGREGRLEDQRAVADTACR